MSTLFANMNSLAVSKAFQTHEYSLSLVGKPYPNYNPESIQGHHLGSVQRSDQKSNQHGNMANEASWYVQLPSRWESMMPFNRAFWVVPQASTRRSVTVVKDWNDAATAEEMKMRPRGLTAARRMYWSSVTSLEDATKHQMKQENTLEAPN